MKPDELTSIMEMLDDVIRNRRGASLFDASRQLTNIGLLWSQEIERVGDPELATAAVAGLFMEASFDRVPTMSEFQDQVRRQRRLRREEADARSQVKGLTPPTEMPDWMPAKLLAMSAGDVRVWPEQKPGYEHMQLQHPHHRVYVWNEQELMPIEDRERYLAQVADLSTEQRIDLMRKVFAGGVG